MEVDLTGFDRGNRPAAHVGRGIKHASWLNMAEIEIGVLRGQCLDRRIDDKQLIIDEVAAWEPRRNAEGAQIQWMFTTEKAREKLRKAYPIKES